MTTQSIALRSFALDVHEGRTRQRLTIHGVEMIRKLSNEDTDGRVAIFHQNIPPMAGPPLHRYSREDECFYVLGADHDRGRRAANYSARWRFGVCASWYGTRLPKLRPAPAQMLVMLSPGHLQQFFEELSLLNPGQSALDPVRVEQLMNKYGAELLGPPLA